MFKPAPRLIRLVFLTMGCLGLGSCGGDPDSVPFPADESEFAQPTERPFKFGEPVPIKWEIYDPSTIKPLVTKKLNFATLPTKPFNIGGYPEAMKAPLEERRPFDWKSAEDTVFDYNSLPTQPLKFKTILMAPPTVIKAGFPNIQAGLTRGVMEAGSTFGLPGNGRCFLQDKSGMFWIGTDKGLARYDGVNLEIFGTEQGIQDPNIWSICEDARQRLWIGTGNGEVFVLDRPSGIILKVADTFPRGSNFGIMRDRDGQMWIARSGQGYIIVNEAAGTVKKFSKREGLAGNNPAIKILQDKDHRIWLNSSSGVTVIDNQAHKLKRLFTEDAIFSLMEDRDGNIWVGGNKGAYILNLEKSTQLHLSSKQGIEGAVFGLLQDKTGIFWLTTDQNKAFAVDLQKNTVEKFTIGSDNRIIYSVVEDAEGQLWLGSVNAGSHVINLNRGRPGNFTTSDGLSSNVIWATLEAKDGKIWLGTTNGIDIYDPTYPTIRHLGIEQGLPVRNMNHLYEDKQGQIWAFGNGFGLTVINVKEGTIKTLGRDQGLRDTDIRRLWEAEGGGMWLGTNDGGLFVYNPGTALYKRISNLATFNDEQILHLTSDASGQMWICNGKGGVVVVDRELKTYKTLTTSQGLLSNTAYNTLESSTGEIWIGTNKGINKLNLKRQTITNFTTQEGLVNNDIWTLNERNGIIYAGTTRGLAMISSTTDAKGTHWRFTNYGKVQGFQFTDFAQNSAHFRSNGEFWAGVEIQVLMVMNDPRPDPAIPTPFITSLSILDNVKNFRQRSKAEQRLAKVDTLWETIDGSFYQDRNKAIAERFAEDEEIKWDSVESNYLLPINLRLPYNQNYLNFSFAGLTLSNPDQVRYRYVLEGIDKNWSPISANSQSENYRDLPPGRYAFKVSAKGMNGTWSEPATFRFTILPPWWKSWWAYAGYVVLLGFAGYRVHVLQKAATVRKERERMRERELAQAKEIEKAYNDLKATQTQLIQSEKMASLGELTAGIAHEIQNPLNFVNNFSEINKELLQEMKEELDKGNLDEAKKISGSIIDNEEKIMFHGKRADSIVKGMLQHSRASSGLKEPTDINALADEYLRLAYHGLRAQDKSFTASMKTEFDTSLGKVNVVPQDMGRVILNLITNAFHAVTERKKESTNGYDPTVTVSTSKKGNQVVIKVSDNGKGIPTHILDKIFQPFFTTKPSGKGTGLGLSMSYDIVTKVHNGQIDVDTRPGEGTSFIVTIPTSNP